MSKSLLVIAMLLVFTQTSCATNAQLLTASMYKTELKQTSSNALSIDISPTTPIEFNITNTKRLKKVWRNEAQLACHGKFQGTPKESIHMASSDGIKITTTKLPNGETKTERTRVSSLSATLEKVSGIAICKKSLAGL